MNFVPQSSRTDDDNTNITTVFPSSILKRRDTPGHNPSSQQPTTSSANINRYNFTASHRP